MASWISQTSGTSDNLLGVCWTGAFAIATDNLHKNIFKSTDAVTWTSHDVTATSGSMSYTTTNGTTVLVTGTDTGSVARIWSSTNGTSWSINNTEDYKRLKYYNTQFLRVKNDGTGVSVSGNGSVWTNSSSVFTAAKSIAYDGSTFVVVGNSGELKTANSVTGTWTARTSNTSNSITDICSDGTVWIAVTLGGDIITGTANGINWTLRSSGTTNNLNAVAYINGRIIAVGQSGTILVSTDHGVTWAAETSGVATHLRDICDMSNAALVVGDSGVILTYGQVETPTHSYDTATYNNSVSVTISCGTSGAAIYYTTDGSTPTASSTLYSSPISVTAPLTLKSIGIKSGFSDSEIKSSTYSFTVLPVTFNPIVLDFYVNTTVTMSSATSGATIYYTTDGSTPDNTKTLYTGSFSQAPISELKAIAYKTSYTTSSVSQTGKTKWVQRTSGHTNDITCVSYSSAGLLTNAWSGSNNYKALGSTDLVTWTSYAFSSDTTSAPLMTSIAKIGAGSLSGYNWAIGYEVGGYSGTGYKTFSTANNTWAVGALSSGATYGRSTEWKILHSDTAAIIVRIGTTSFIVGSPSLLTAGSDGFGPTKASSLASLNDAIWQPATSRIIAIGNSGVINSLSSSSWVTSAAVTVSYTSTVTANNLNAIISDGTNFIIVGNSGTIITSPVGDGVTWTQRTSGTTENLKSIAFGIEGIFAVGLNCTILISLDHGVTWTTDMPTVTSLQLNDICDASQALVSVGNSGTVLTRFYKTLTPVISLATGTYNNSQSVTITCGTSGSAIYYTTDGSTPDNTKTLYTGAITINSTGTVLKAIGITSGRQDSEIAIETYTFTVGDITVTPDGGSYSDTQSFTLSTVTTSANIYYTLDGSTPDNTKTLYSGAVSLPSSGSPVTMKAVGIKANYNDSAVKTSTFTFTVATPTSNTSSTTTINSLTGVTLSDATSGSAIHYTIDGSPPTIASTLYTVPLSFSVTTTLKAIGTRTYFADSAVLTIVNTIKCAPVLSDIASGDYNNNQLVTLTTTKVGASIYFTLDGTTPDNTKTLYTAPFTISATGTTLKTIAIASGCTDSDVTTYTYTLTCSAPTASPAAGSFTSAQNITLSSATSSTTIYYTLDGTTPDNTKTLYTGPIALADNSDVPYTLKAIAYRTNYVTSSVYSGSFAINVVDLPVFSPLYTLAPFYDSVSVTITTLPVDATLRYTLDGTTPNPSSSLYSVPVTFTHTKTLKAYGYKASYGDSPVASALYQFKVSPITVVPASGTYTNAQVISMSTTTPDADIYYTLDGTTPTTSSTLYTGPFALFCDRTLKARGFYAGDLDSDVTTRDYQFETIVPPTHSVNPNVTMSTLPLTVTLIPNACGQDIRYTLDGSAPTLASTLYTVPFVITDETLIRSVSISPFNRLSEEDQFRLIITTVDPLGSIRKRIRDALKYQISQLTFSNGNAMGDVRDEQANNDEVINYPACNIMFRPEEYMNFKNHALTSGLLMHRERIAVLEFLISNINRENNEREIIQSEIEDYFMNNFNITGESGDEYALDCIFLGSNMDGIRDMEPHSILTIELRIVYRTPLMNPYKSR